MNKISEQLGIAYEPEDGEFAEVTSKPIVVAETKTDLAVVNKPQDETEDYVLSRDTYHNLINIGNKAVKELKDLAHESQHPKAYEVLATMIKTMSDTAKNLNELHKKDANLRTKHEDKPPSSINVEQGVFVGSMTDILRNKQNKE